ncbi:MAG: hypothetical protein IT383_11630 [Deltaproteobacteria bacterium]|nr:hypothetical protein [Deltaproteobacteria bacterium]
MQDGERLRRRACLLVSGVVLAWAGPAGAMAEELVEGELPTESAAPVFLVTEVVVGEGVAVDKDAARDVLANRFGRLKDKIEVRSLAEVKSSLDRAAMAQMLGSTESDGDLAKIGEYVAVDHIVFGRIAQVAGVTEVQVKIFNTKDGVTEAGYSRRLKAGAPPQLVLTLLDTLADNLLAFAIDAYTDAVPDAQFLALKNKKLTPRAATVAASPWSMLGVVGGAVTGAGVGAGALGGYVLATGQGDQTMGLVLAGAGAGAALVGTGLVVADGLTE